MTERSKTEYLNPDYIRFGREQRRISEILDKKQRDQNSKKNKNNEESPKKEEPKTSDFIDRSAQLNASLNSLALSNMVKLKRLEKKSNIDVLIEQKPQNNSENFNPFAEKD